MLWYMMPRKSFLDSGVKLPLLSNALLYCVWLMKPLWLIHFRTFAPLASTSPANDISSSEVLSNRLANERISVPMRCKVFLGLIRSTPPLSVSCATNWPRLRASVSSTWSIFTNTGLCMGAMSSARSPNSSAWSFRYCLYASACSEWLSHIRRKASLRLFPCITSPRSFTVGAPV